MDNLIKNGLSNKDELNLSIAMGETGLVVPPDDSQALGAAMQSFMG